MLGLTQQEIAEKLGISKQSYWMKENGNTSFSNDEMRNFKSLLVPLFPKITIDDIFFGEKVS
jgi:putative transcriptional regulator